MHRMAQLLNSSLGTISFPASGKLHSVSFFGALMVWAVLELRARYELHQAQQAADAFVAAAAQAADEASARTRRHEADMLAAERRAQSQRERVELARRQKEAAWQRFFQPSPQCLNSTNVECGNAHIRARREFERRYAAGDL